MAEAFGSESHFYPQNTLLSCIRIIFIWFGVKYFFSLKSHTPVSHFMICFSTYAELPEAIRTYHLDARIEEAKRRGMWMHSYIEAHIWDPDIKVKLRG